jgi:hypothetical protein
MPCGLREHSLFFVPRCLLLLVIGLFIFIELYPPRHVTARKEGHNSHGANRRPGHYFSSVVIIFVLIPSLCSHHYHRTERCYAIA